MPKDFKAIDDLISYRVRIEELEQDRSDALYLVYGIVIANLAIVPEDTRPHFTRSVYLAVLQLNQGCRLGRRLIALDKQFGGLLEEKGIWLERWVHEPRNK